MKTSNLLIIIFLGSFFLISAVGFTLGKFYPADRSTTNFTVEREELESFSVVVSQGVKFNISLADSSYFTYNKPNLLNNDIDLSILPYIEVRNDTCFVSFIGSGNQAYIRLYSKSLQAVNLENNASMVANGVSFDSLIVRSLGSKINFNNNVFIDYLNIEIEGKSTSYLGSVLHLDVTSNGTNIQAKGTNFVKGSIINGGQLHLSNSKPKLDFQVDESSRIYIQ